MAVPVVRRASVGHRLCLTSWGGWVTFFFNVISNVEKNCKTSTEKSRIAFI